MALFDAGRHVHRLGSTVVRAVRLPSGVADEFAAHLSLHGTNQRLCVLALRSHYVLAGSSLPMQRFDIIGSFGMEHDLQLRAAARAIYDACYPSDEWAPFGFDEAERFRTIHYRQAVGAALQARRALYDRAVQPTLFAEQARA